MAACDTSSASHALVMAGSGGSGLGTLALPVMQVTTCLPYGLSAFFCFGTLRTPLGPFLCVDMIDSRGVVSPWRPVSARGRCRVRPTLGATGVPGLPGRGGAGEDGSIGPHLRGVAAH